MVLKVMENQFQCSVLTLLHLPVDCHSIEIFLQFLPHVICICEFIEVYTEDCIAELGYA